MPKRSSKPERPSDTNLLARQIVEEAIGGPLIEADGKFTIQPEKNPAAVALGRLGGLKGGKARAEKLSARKRKAIAKKAAKARWGTNSSPAE